MSDFWVTFARAVCGFCLVVNAASFASAQTAPSATEIAAYTGVQAAAARGDVAVLGQLLAAKPDLEAQDGHGRTAVLIAAHGGHLEVVRLLAQAGAVMTAKDSRNYDIVTIAAVRDDARMVGEAISLGADARAITSPYQGTALIAAAHLGHDAVIRALIAAKAPLDHVNTLGWTAVMEAVVLGDGGPRHQRSLQALIEAGADVRLADPGGVTPLQHARQRGYADMVLMLERAERR